MMPVAAVRICRGHLLSPTYCTIGAHAIQSKFLREKKRRILVSPREEPSLMGGQEGCRFTSSKPNSEQMKSD